MNRKSFLKTMGLSGLGLSIGRGNTMTQLNALATTPTCELIPSETAGPFPLDLTENTQFFRQDITEGKEGIELTLRMKIFGVNNCEPMPNVRVNIWHCDKDGNYSGYQAQSGQTFMRGYQITDANGEVEFKTIFPGWYNGRICHIHFQVAVSSSYAAVSQFTFPLEIRNQIYLDNPAIYTKGADPLTFSTDFAFADSYELQLATLEANGDGTYMSYMEVGVQGEGTVGVGHQENQIAEVFDLGQNFPNPYRMTTTIPVKLRQAADVKLELYDLQGKKVATALDERKASGEFNIAIDLTKLGLAKGSYIYQFEAKTNEGTFRLSKMMTAMK